MTSHELTIQQSFAGEFLQHDDMMTVMMFYRRRASPKHRYDIIKVDYGGGGHRTQLRDPRDQLLFCLEVPPLPPYIKEPGEGVGRPGGARQEESSSHRE